VAISVFSPSKFGEFLAIFPQRKPLKNSQCPKKKRKKNQCEFARKKTPLLAIETLQNHFIFEFLVFKFFLFGEDSLVKKNG